MNEIKNGSGGNPEAMFNLGAWLGRHQAFGTIANRCSAADAECLKTIRDGGLYKQLDLTWEEFCVKHAGVSRVHADRMIKYREELGVNYHRFGEVMAISPATYRLIAGAVSDEGIEFNGERIPLVRENREKIAAAVKAIRATAETKTGGGKVIAELRKRLDALLADAHAAANRADRRREVIVLVDEGCESLQRLGQALRERAQPLT